jgi:plasmid stabilization system protein ParE
VEIDAYIRNEFCNPTAAENTVKKILRTIAVLEDSPEIGTPLSAIVDIETNYRFLVSGAYLTFYRYVKGACEIDRVLYGRRDYMTILFKNDADEE